MLPVRLESVLSVRTEVDEGVAHADDEVGTLDGGTPPLSVQKVHGGAKKALLGEVGGGSVGGTGLQLWLCVGDGD